jgi:hypothetical protein
MSVQRSRIECFTLATRRFEPLAETHQLNLLPSTWGPPWMGLDANDMPLVTADRDTSALYSLDWDPP